MTTGLLQFHTGVVIDQCKDMHSYSKTRPEKQRIQIRNFTDVYLSFRSAVVADEMMTWSQQYLLLF